jgi:hypothetical protein
MNRLAVICIFNLIAVAASAQCTEILQQVGPPQYGCGGYTVVPTVDPITMTNGFDVPGVVVPLFGQATYEVLSGQGNPVYFNDGAGWIAEYPFSSSPWDADYDFSRELQELEDPL